MSTFPPGPVVPLNTVTLRQVRASTWVAVGYKGPRRITYFLNPKPTTVTAVDNISAFSVQNPTVNWSRLGDEDTLLIDLTITPTASLETMTIGGLPQAAVSGTIYSDMAQAENTVSGDFGLVNLELDPSSSTTELVFRDYTGTLFVTAQPVRITGSFAYRVVA